MRGFLVGCGLFLDRLFADLFHNFRLGDKYQFHDWFLFPV